MRDLTAFILAGGSSTRMGEDKAFIELGGRLLIDRAMRRMKAFDCDIFIVGPKAKFNAFGRIVEDEFPGRGPLGGIHAALKRSETEFNLITAVDLPLLPNGFFEAILEAARGSDAEVVIPHASGLHPLCGVYRKSFFTAAQEALKQDKLKIDRVIESRPHLFFDAEAHGFSSELFLNLNTPEDLKIAKRRLAAEAAHAAQRVTT